MIGIPFQRTVLGTCLAWLPLLFHMRQFVRDQSVTHQRSRPVLACTESHMVSYRKGPGIHFVRHVGGIAIRVDSDTGKICSKSLFHFTAGMIFQRFSRSKVLQNRFRGSCFRPTGCLRTSRRLLPGYSLAASRVGKEGFTRRPRLERAGPLLFIEKVPPPGRLRGLDM